MEDTKKWARGSCDRLSRSRLQEDEEEEPTKVRLGLSADNSDFDMSMSSIGVTKRRKSSFMVEPTKLRKRPREGSENLGYISSSSSNNKGNRGQIRDQIVMMKNQSKMMHPRNGIYSRFFSILAAAATLSILTVSLINNNQISAQATTASNGCPYPGVNSNCQVNIISQAPAVPLLSTYFVADEYATLKPDTQASYKCDQGYELIGQEMSTCLSSGRWSSSPPSCVTNIAIGKPTNQSSTVKGGDSRNANDGKLITQHDSKYCTETRVDQSPWWQIDLLQLYEIRSVRLLGRACCNPQLSLHDIEIRVGNSSTLQGNRLCAWYPNNLDEGVAKDFQCAHPIIGRFVSIQMVGIEGALSLCEVMVMSTREFPNDRCSVQATLAPSNGKPAQAVTTTTSATTTTSSNSASSGSDNQLVVFNRTCYEFQTTNGGSFLVADTYCKARGGALLNSVTNLTQLFISQELERMKSKLKSKMVWLGAKREVSSSNAFGSITPGSSSALISTNDSPMKFPSGRSLSQAALDEFFPDRVFSGDQGGLIGSGESSPIFSPLTAARTSLYQISSGAGGATSRGSQTFGLPTTGIQQSSLNRTIEHPQRSLIVSQPNQVAAFFTPPVPISSTSNSQPTINLPTPSSSPAINFSPSSHIHRSLRPPSLVSTTQAPAFSSSSTQITWSNPASNTGSSSPQSTSSAWRWASDNLNEIPPTSVQSFLWAEDQPNNYNNQQDCIVLDGGKKWLWNDVTCELDFLPWVCQFRASTCGSPDRNENSTILEISSLQDSTNGVSIQEPVYQYGKTITYACPIGHRLDGSKQRKCQHDGLWSGKAPKCQYINCGPLNGNIENGRIVYLNESQTTYGSQVKYVCFEDYVLVGNDLRQCQSDGRWAGKQPYCAYKWCPKLNPIPNGNLNVSGFSENSIASYQCASGFKLIGDDTRQCLLGGKWTNQEPFCQYVDCGEPKQISNGNYQLVNSTTNYLSIAQYTCNDNYTLVNVDNSKLICSHDNRWTGKEPQCSLIDCGQPQANAGSSFSGDSYTVHSMVDYKCDLGFKEIGGNTQRACGLDGQWTGQPISCKYVDCGRVPAILKGEVSYINGTTYLASQVLYECTPGNRLSGHRIRFCGPDGRWTGGSPKCEEVRCDAPSLPTNGSAIYIGNDRSFKEQSFSVGVTVQYECDYGHVVKGSWSSRLCQANGEWSGEPPICKFVDCGLPPNIENGNYVLKHPPSGSVGSATPIEGAGLNIRRSDSVSNSNAGGQTGTFTYFGTIAHYNCDSNFKMQGPAQRECLESGQWRSPMPTCEPVQCPKPEYFDEYTQVSLVPRSAVATATDNISELAHGGRSIKLIANNQWLNQDLSQHQTFNVGDKLLFNCIPGYELYGGPEVRTCTQYGQWSGSSTPRCRLIDCGRPNPIGQEGRFYLLNETTTFNSIVEYSCVRPFKLIELKLKLSGNLIEILNVAQAGVTPILTSLPIGVKVCANNGQWMPNDQQPKCVSPSDTPLANNVGQQFDGGDNTLDGSQRVQVANGGSGGSSSNSGSFATTNINQDDSNLDNSAIGGHQRHQAQAASTSLWAKIMIAVCLLVMLALIILTLICIKSGKSKKPKQTAMTSGNNGQQHSRNVMLTESGHHHNSAAAAAAAAAMQIQLAGGMAVGSGKQQQHSQQQVVPGGGGQHALSNQNIYINGAPHKIFSQGNLVAQGGQLMSAANLHHPMNQAHHLVNHAAMPYGDGNLTMNHNQGLMLAAAVGMNNTGRQMISINGNDMSLANGKSSSLSIAGRAKSNQSSNEHHHQLSTSSMIDSYSRLSIESAHDMQQQGGNKTIRHNPNGLVTFVSPAQQQQQNRANGNGQQQSSSLTSSTTSQHQVSPQSISTSLSISSSSSPSSSSSSAHHTTATRLSGSTDSAGSSSSPPHQHQRHNNGIANSYQQPQASPPSLPTHPPPPHRLQQHHKQLMKASNGTSRAQNQIVTDPSSQQQLGNSNHHQMGPSI